MLVGSNRVSLQICDLSINEAPNVVRFADDHTEPRKDSFAFYWFSQIGSRLFFWFLSRLKRHFL